MAALTNPTPPVSSPIRIRPGKRNSLRQIIDLQRQLYEAAMVKGITPSALAQVARAWSELEERKRILRMRPKPKDVDVEKLKDAKRREGIDVRSLCPPLERSQPGDIIIGAEMEDPETEVKVTEKDSEPIANSHGITNTKSNGTSSSVPKPLTDEQKIARLLAEAERGLPDAQCALADCYVFGKGVQQSNFEGYKWACLAAGHAPSDWRWGKDVDKAQRFEWVCKIRGMLRWRLSPSEYTRAEGLIVAHVEKFRTSYSGGINRFHAQRSAS